MRYPRTALLVLCVVRTASEEFTTSSQYATSGENFVETYVQSEMSEWFNNEKHKDVPMQEWVNVAEMKSFFITGARRKRYSYSIKDSEVKENKSEMNNQDFVNETATKFNSNGSCCIPVCCERGFLFHDLKCHSNASMPLTELILPEIFNNELQPSKKRPEDVQRIHGIPCPYVTVALVPAKEEFYLLENGTFCMKNTYRFQPKIALNYTDYCFAMIYDGSRVTTALAICYDPFEGEVTPLYPITMILGMPFFVATFIVYSVIPELDTVHGKNLRAYIANLFIAMLALTIVQIGDQTVANNLDLCIVLAFIIHFSFLASFFWLNVMCFDIWWTFGGFRSLQGSAKQRERKKFLIYSIYAWGCASLITGICVIMDYLPGIPEYFIKPEFGADSCWFNSNAAKALYFYGPMGVTVFCNICLFISTAMKISQHKKDTAHHLKGSESRRHDDNKQWFNLYLKLFIVMGINWSMEIISWLCKGPQYVWYITDLANSLQGLIIFIIFVWKDKIKRLLLKRFGCHDRNYLSRNSTRSVCHSSASRTCTTSAPLQEKTNPFVTESSRNKTTSEESDCV